jgi:hypothetical protein
MQPSSAHVVNYKDESMNEPAVSSSCRYHICREEVTLQTFYMQEFDPGPACADQPYHRPMDAITCKYFENDRWNGCQDVLLPVPFNVFNTITHILS